MATRVPLVLASGERQQLQTDEALLLTAIAIQRVLDTSCKMPSNSSLFVLDSFTIPSGVTFTIPGSSALGISPIPGIVSRPYDFANSVNTAIDFPSTSYQSLVSTTALSLAVNDTILINIYGGLVNNSASTRTYSHQLKVGSVTLIDAVDTTAINASSSLSTIYAMTFIVSISASNVWRVIGIIGRLSTGNAVGSNSFSPSGSWSPIAAWNSGTNDLTGLQTISVNMKTNGVGAANTQTFTLHGYNIQRIPKITPS